MIVAKIHAFDALVLLTPTPSETLILSKYWVYHLCENSSKKIHRKKNYYLLPSKKTDLTTMLEVLALSLKVNHHLN